MCLIMMSSDNVLALNNSLMFDERGKSSYYLLQTEQNIYKGDEYRVGGWNV